MGYLQEIRRGLSNVSSLRQEKAAVPSAQTRPLLKRFAQRAGAELGSESSFANRRLKQRYALANIGRDIRSANIDAATSLPITAIRAGLEVKEAKKREAQDKLARENSERVIGVLNEIGEMYRANPVRVMDALKGVNIIPQPPTTLEVGG